jgi:hypothetical protein
MLFKESGNVEIVCSFAYAALEWKFIYLITNAEKFSRSVVIDYI